MEKEIAERRMRDGRGSGNGSSPWRKTKGARCVASSFARNRRCLEEERSDDAQWWKGRNMARRRLDDRRNGRKDKNILSATIKSASGGFYCIFAGYRSIKSR